MQSFLDLVPVAPDRSLLFEGVYDPLLVTLSVVTAILASYAALLVAERVEASRQVLGRRLWTAVGGVCLGAGIWTMHFVGMLAFSLPCITSYDPPITLASMVPGILASTLAVAGISRRSISPPRLLANGVLLGAGIGTMHFSGMAAMHLEGMIRYDIRLFAISIVMAVALATLALWTRFRLRALAGRWSGWGAAASAVVMGCAVSGMHYTAMAATYFIRGGEPAAENADITQTFLASVVLVVAVAIIVITLVATFMKRSASLRFANILKVVGVIAGLWVGVAWLSSNSYSDRQGKEAYVRLAVEAHRQVEDLSDKIDGELKVVQGTAYLLSVDEGIVKVLSRFPRDVRPSTMEVGALRAEWGRDPALMRVGNFLSSAAGNLDVDVVFVLNAAGDCVASSNAGTLRSLVGANFSDRDYFLQARAGQPGNQYAMGRVTKTPGLYYSAPVYGEGRFLGAVVSKREVADFGPWVERARAFISDANGVIILAADPELRYRTLPGAPVLDLPEAERRLQYGDGELKPVAMAEWRERDQPEVVRIGPRLQPMILASKPSSGGTITVHVIRPIMDLMHIESRRGWLFALLAAAGSLLIIATTAIAMYLHTIGHAKTILSEHAAELERSNADLEQFAYVASHDLQTPLRNIASYTQLLERRYKGSLGDDADDFIGFIVDNTKKMSRLITDLLEYSRISRGSEPLKAVSAQAAITHALENLKLDVAKAGASITVGPMPEVMADTSHLISLFQNILGNCVKYRSPDRKLTLSVTAERASSELWKFAVSDNGIGIEAEYYDKIFEIFQRLNPAGETEGTGIGLTLCRRIVHRFGGNIWVESEPGAGTTFFFTLHDGGE